ncbi:uncharacterized protein LOC120527410 [Polypterus senegalus]|uniref:uncharacterized protein LOC120527410 n=1 Tax=Polypterus senegalus TaxID=55291 RepID=UPI0019655982|nr:uncharacterized protein LOC120527410 [Polypterus senegalus]
MTVPPALETPPSASGTMIVPRALETPSATASVTVPPALETPPTACATVTVPPTTIVYTGKVRLRAVVRMRCPICNVQINKWNLKNHIDRKHTEQKTQDVNAKCHLTSQCIDGKNGIFAVMKTFKGHSIPLHVQCKTWGEVHTVLCESNECQINMEVAQRSGLVSYHCKHIRSVSYCASLAKTVLLSEKVLSEMESAKWFSEEKKKACLARQQLANTNRVPLSVITTIGIPQTKKCISVYEPSMSYYSRLGRVIVVYDAKLNTWHCPCARLRRSCIHKYIAKWHLFETHRELFRTVISTEEALQANEQLSSFEERNVKDDHSVYPPKGVGLESIVTYILRNKKIPAALPKDLCVPTAYRHYPKNLFPEETMCQRCPSIVPLSDPMLITRKAKILTNWCIIEDISTYCKQCPQCGMFYRYQEWKDHLHNFNDYIILDLALCLTLRNLLQVHTAVSRAVEYLQLTAGVQFPPSDTVLHAYLHFEALTDHEYKYSCVTCGDHPPVVVMDLHKKGVFKISVNDIKKPPENFRGEVDLETFWDALSKEMICRGFVVSGRCNPFAVPPIFNIWAPWIGRRTRRSNVVVNTEFEKIHSPKSLSEAAEISVSEDRLIDELFKQKVEVIRKLCKECGLDSSGSRSDLLLRLSNEIKSRQMYDKIFQKIWAVSGGWAVIMCPCGIVYSLKCNLRAESPRDFADLLLSWKHMPNVVIYDFARGLATHTNLRVPEKLPFSPFEGRLAEPTESSRAMAACGKLKVSLPWLNTKKIMADPDGHPTTGSSDHYALYDRFHESNTKDRRDILRKLTLVPQLAGRVNSQVAEQLFAKMRKNNYFLNMTMPSTHLFQMRNIIHHYNQNRNNNILNRLKKTLGSEMVMNVHGLAMLGNPDVHPEETNPDMDRTSSLANIATVAREENPVLINVKTASTKEYPIVYRIQDLSASRTCWDCQPSNEQIKMLDWILGKNDPEEKVAEVGNITLQRKDFWTLGHNEELEATIANSCLQAIALVADIQGKDVLAVDAYVVVTWLPPLNQDPFLSFPNNIALKDYLLFPELWLIFPY